jgi:Zn-dependent protease
MRGSIQIAKFFGIPVNVHWSFGLLFLFVIYIGLDKNTSWEGIGVMSLFVIALFVCVVLHEYGHALSARRYGVGTRDITILPIGGVARLDRLPEKPFQEFVVAIAGPAVNVLIFTVLGLYLFLKYDLTFNSLELLNSETDEIIISPVAGFFANLMQANFWLVVFNMIPAFPMDGGRVLRALLSMRIGRTKATQIAAILGQICSVGFLIYGIWHFQPVLAIISVFIFYTARQEYQHVKLDEMLSRHTVTNILRTHFTSFKTSDYIHLAASEMAKGVESDFLVFDDAEQLRGVLQDEDILDAAKNKQYEAIVSTYMTPNYLKASPFESIKEVYNRMLQSGQYLLPVMDNGQLLGVIDMTMLQNFIKIQNRIA